MAHSFSNGIVISYVLPVLWITSCYHTIWRGANGPELSTALCLDEVLQVAVPVGRQRTVVFGRVRQNAALAWSLLSTIDLFQLHTYNLGRVWHSVIPDTVRLRRVCIVWQYVETCIALFSAEDWRLFRPSYLTVFDLYHFLCLLARDVIYTSRAYATMSVSVCLSVYLWRKCIGVGAL